MASDSFEVSEVIPAPRELLYAAWLTSAEHSAMTGAQAEIDPTVNGDFTAWDGYIRGTTLELDPDRLIVQRWRTTDFSEADAPSRVEIWFDPDESGGTKLTIRHSDLPDGQGERYRTGWVDSYLTPMKAYFSRAPKAPFPPPDEEAPEELPMPIDEGEIEAKARTAAAAAKTVAPAAKPRAEKRPPAKKARPTAKKKPAAKKRPAARKAAPKKSAGKKRPAAKKRTTAKKTTGARKAAARKSPARKSPAKKKSTGKKRR